MKSVPLQPIEPSMAAYLRERAVAVSFSGGKDSLAMWLALERHGIRPTMAFYLYTVPGLGFVERYLEKCERHFDMPIERVPHPSLVRMLHNGIFQAPDTYDHAVAVPRWGHVELDAWVREYAEVQTIGARTQDTLVRRASAKKHGVVNERRGTAWPIHDWYPSHVMAEIDASPLKLPVDYRMFGRSFDGIHYQYIKPILEHYPEDFAKIERLFPLVRAELVRRDR